MGTWTATRFEDDQHLDQDDPTLSRFLELREDHQRKTSLRLTGNWLESGILICSGSSCSYCYSCEPSTPPTSTPVFLLLILLLIFNSTAPPPLLPSYCRTPEEKELGEKKFMQIATAYETLREDESRADYDYMLVRC